MAEIAICIATCKRPAGLRRTLESLAILRTAHGIRIIVADNDGEKQQGLATVEAMASQGYRWPIIAMVVRERGIPQVRNALVEQALTLPDLDAVVMLDDDEAASPDWLDALIACQSDTGADVVGGAVLREMDGDVAGWAARHPLLQPKSRGASGPVALIDSTANVLIQAAALRTMGDRPFDERMALTGGSDKQLFTRMQRAGYSFGWSEEAVVTELIPASRVSAQWLLMRGYRVGMTDMRIAIYHSSRVRALVMEAPRILAGLLIGTAGAALSFDHGTRVQRLGKLYRAAGKIAAVAGVRYEEYRKVHGA
ncbi:GT2 family glycosyltransferase [Sphingomonas sp. UYAg733]